MALNKKELIAFRRNLHEHPEESGKEEKTARRIADTLRLFRPDKMITEIGGHGVAAVFEGVNTDNGPTVLLRAELDAVLADEENEYDYKSKTPGIAHLCGHDGHMTILVAVASKLKEVMKNRTGRVVLLFQPSEETGAGAKAVIEDEKFKEITPDYAFALHNFPGYSLGEVITKKNVILMASKGLLVKLKGKTAHSAYPNLGIDPSDAIIQIRAGLKTIPNILYASDNKINTFVTIPYFESGEPSFGTTPGSSKVMATLRAFRDDKMDKLSKKAIEVVTQIVDEHNKAIEQIKGKNYDPKRDNIIPTIEWSDDFPATKNHEKCVQFIRKTAHDLGLDRKRLNHPKRWSEDFSYYGRLKNRRGYKVKTGFVGLGAGENHPDPHSPEYDFPDDLIAIGSKFFNKLILNILDEKKDKQSKRKTKKIIRA